MAKAKAKVTVKTKKKLWYPIHAPKSLANKPLGETYQIAPEQALGQSLLVNLREFTENMKDQNAYLMFRVKAVTGNTLTTEVVSYYLTPAYVKKLVKRNSDKIADSLVIATAENKQVRIKPLVLTRNNTSNSKNREIRKAMHDYLTKEFKKLNFGNLVDKLIAHKLQNDMKKELAKVFPIKVCEIRVMRLEENVKGQVAEEVEELVEKPEEIPEEKPAEKTVEKAKPVEKPVEKAEA